MQQASFSSSPIKNDDYSRHSTALMRFARAATITLIALLTAGVSEPAQANDYPTEARVDYVLTCLGGNQSRAAIQACVCRFDALAARLTYDDYTGVETVLALQAAAGSRAPMAHAARWEQDLLDRFRAAETDGEVECH